MDVGTPGGVLQRLIAAFDGLIGTLAKLRGKFMEAFGGSEFFAIFSRCEHVAAVCVLV